MNKNYKTKIFKISTVFFVQVFYFIFESGGFFQSHSVEETVTLRKIYNLLQNSDFQSYFIYYTKVMKILSSNKVYVQFVQCKKLYTFCLTYYTNFIKSTSTWF